MILHLDRDKDTLVEWLRTWRAGDSRITTTNGVFDVIHAGHIQTLKQAMIGADKLIVGLNSDASVKRQGKGTERPVQDEMSRAIVLDAIRWVDVVVIYEEDTPCELLEIIRPNIHIKGGDYDIEQMPETPVVRKYGGVVKTVPLLDGYSTTNLVKRIVLAHCPNIEGCPVRYGIKPKWFPTHSDRIHINAPMNIGEEVNEDDH